MAERPRVSVIVPFRDRIPWLEEAVRSVLAQSFGDFEMILVDDGSTRKAEFLSALRDDRIRYLRLPPRGAAAARNRGIELARGAYIAFLDSDDLFFPDKLAVQVAAMDSDPSVPLSHTSYIRIDPGGAEIEAVPSGRFAGEVYPGIIFRCPIATPTVMIRRDALGGLRFPEGVTAGEDIVLWTRIARRHAIMGLDRPLTRVRLHEHSACADIDVQHRGVLAVLGHAFAEDPSFPPALRRDVLARIWKRRGHLSLARDDRKAALARFLRALAYRPLDREALGLAARLLLPRPVKAPLHRLRDLSRGEMLGEAREVLRPALLPPGPAEPGPVPPEARCRGFRMAVVSHILPPSPSGQSMVLARLLREWPAESYCLLSRERCDAVHGEVDEGRLPGRHHHLRPAHQAPEGGVPFLSAWAFRRHAARAIAERGRRIAAVLREENCSLVVGCTGDLYDLPAAALAARLAAVPFVAHIFDDYAFQWTGPARTLARRFEYDVVDAAAGVIVPNEFLRREYLRRHGIDCEVIPNPCPLPDLAALDAAPSLFDAGETSLVYAGAVYHAHFDAFRNLLEAIRRLGRPDVRLHLFTAQSPEAVAEAGIAGPAVVHHPHVPPAEVPRILRQARILFLPLAFDSPIPEVVQTSAPGKTGEYLAAARPVLVHAPEDSFASWYFRTNRCGLVVGRNDPGALAAALGRLLAEPELCESLGRAGRMAAERDFDADRIRARFARFVEKMAAG